MGRVRKFSIGERVYRAGHISEGKGTVEAYKSSDGEFRYAVVWDWDKVHHAAVATLPESQLEIVPRYLAVAVDKNSNKELASVEDEEPRIYPESRALLSEAERMILVKFAFSSYFYFNHMDRISRKIWYVDVVRL